MEDLITKYHKKGILIDTNILLLYLVGCYDKERISKFKNTNQFVVEDFDYLTKILKYFEVIITTPNILSEANSLLGQLGEPARSQLFEDLSKRICILEEHYVESKNVASNKEFIKYGLTDTIIINLSHHPFLVLTDDFKLSQYLGKNKVDVINFNHIRVNAWS